MEVRDGFIVSIFNYCDSWCERCKFTSHCRVFADIAEMEARHDPHQAPITEAPLLPHEVPPPPPPWMQELIDDMNEASRNPPSGEGWEKMRPRIPSEHSPVNKRAKQYAARTYQWLSAIETTPPNEPRNVISWFHSMIRVKVNRALTVWPDDDEDFKSSDADGSAKVALIGIDRSHAAWLALVEGSAITAAEAEPFIADLVWLGEALERIRPRARAFIRPGFDEPEEVEKFLAAQRWR